MIDDVVVIGGGAAGFFAAIRAASLGKKVTICEKSLKPLAKVRISGGGRCNVTHACFDPKELTQNYPRGSFELRGPFSRFQPKDTVSWFEERGVSLKTEEDGRMFPITDSSQTIVDCLQRECAKNGVTLRLGAAVEGIVPEANGFTLKLSGQDSIQCSKLILATGSNRSILELARGLGHTIVPCVPSLFTFNIANFGLKSLAGVSVQQAKVKVLGLERTGPLLITHWGFSGPAVLKLSAFGARLLFEKNYKAELTVDWQADLAIEEKEKLLQQVKAEHAKKQIGNVCPFRLANSLWRALLAHAGIDDASRLADLSRESARKLVDQLHRMSFQIDGQTTYKEEFVTAGGIRLDEVNFKTMHSKIVPNLFFAGEILDIDGITGGFNFQNAWTSGWIAGTSV